MAALIYDSTAQAFKEAETPKIHSAAENAYVDAGGRARNKEAQAWGDVFSIKVPNEYSYVAKMSNPPFPITAAGTDYGLILRDGIHYQTDGGGRHSTYRNPVLMTRGMTIEIHAKSYTYGGNINNSTCFLMGINTSSNPWDYNGSYLKTRTPIRSGGEGTPYPDGYCIYDCVANCTLYTLGVYYGACIVDKIIIQ